MRNSGLSDDDFRAPPRRTTIELVDSIRRQFEAEVSWSPDLVEELRLLILVRHYEGQPPQEIVDEITQLGGDANFVARREFVSELVDSTFRTGHFGEIEIEREVVIGGFSAGTYRNPLFDKMRRSSDRAAALHERAKRMARRDGDEHDPQLAFPIDGNVGRNSDSNRRPAPYSSTLVLGVVTAIVVLVLLFTFAT